jgi:hypothetical protein
MNRSEVSQTVVLPVAGVAAWQDRLGDGPVLVAQDDRIALTLAPLWGAVLTPS